MEKTFGLQDRVTINVAGIVELDLETTLTTKNVGVVVGTFEDLTVGLPQEVDVDFGEEIGIIEAIPCEFLKEHVEVKQVSIQYKDDDSDGEYKWKVYVDGKRYATGKTRGDVGALVDEYLTENPNAVFIK